MTRATCSGRTPALVDEEIKKQLELLSDLRAEKNSFLPIFRLLPETLEHIFILLARDVYHETLYSENFQGVPDWINVSCVCRYWRNIALNCPTLWTYQPTVSLRWTKELLVRSKRAPLKIHFRLVYVVEEEEGQWPEFWWFEHMEELLNHVGRIQELRLTLSNNSDVPIKRFLRAPCLQILDIAGGRLTELDLATDNRDTLPLRQLILSDCQLPWHLLNLTGLTKLYLESCPPSSKRNVVELLSKLPHMHGLAVLHLDHALAPARDFTSDVYRRVELSSLVSLVVKDPLSTVVALLSCIKIPLKTELLLDFKPEDGSRDYVQIPFVLARVFNHSQKPSPFNPTIRSLAIDFRTLTISGDYDLLVSTGHLRRLSITFPPVMSTEKEASVKARDSDDIINDTLCALPLPHVQMLHVILPSPSHNFWKKISDCFPELRHLKLSDGPMPDLASLFTLAVDGSVSMRGTSDCAPTLKYQFVPTLEELELDRIKFSPDDEPSGDILSRKSLLDALSVRKALRLSEPGRG